MQFRVRFYYDTGGNKPLISFLEELRKQDRILHKLVVAGIKKLETSERHGPPLTQLVDHKYNIFELRIGDKNIARVFFFFSARPRDYLDQWLCQETAESRYGRT